MILQKISKVRWIASVQCLISWKRNGVTCSQGSTQTDVPVVSQFSSVAPWVFRRTRSKNCNFPTDSCRFPAKTDNIVQNFNFTPKVPQNSGFPVPNVAFWEDNFPSKKIFFWQARICKEQLPTDSTCHDATDFMTTKNWKCMYQLQQQQQLDTGSDSSSYQPTVVQANLIQSCHEYQKSVAYWVAGNHQRWVSRISLMMWLARCSACNVSIQQSTASKWQKKKNSHACTACC